MPAIYCGYLLWASAQAADVNQLLDAAAQAIKQGQLKKALPLLDKAMALAPEDNRPVMMRGSLQASLGRQQEAVADFSKVIERDPRAADAFQQRGMAYFKLANFKASITDFDKFIELRPERKPWHWQRGISYYYAGRFDDGRKQFEGYQTVDSSDVENVVWRYMCMARKEGVKKARQEMLKVGKDERIPMKEIYEMFLGRVSPEDVLAAARAGKPSPKQLEHRLFYAHLYIGLFSECEGDGKKTLEHLGLATDKYPVGHYMWEVARVHRDLLRKKK